MSSVHRHDSTPGTGAIEPATGDIVDDSTPGTGDPLKKGETHEEGMRRWLVYGILGIVGLSVILGGIGWLMGRDVEKWLAYSAPLFTLAGTILAYYFKSSD